MSSASTRSAIGVGFELAATFSILDKVAEMVVEEVAGMLVSFEVALLSFISLIVTITYFSMLCFVRFLSSEE